jgi:hypothetical protein
MKNVIKVVVLVCTALAAVAFAACNVSASLEGANLSAETVWISLTPTKADGSRTATLVLDFDKAITGLTDDLNAEGLAKLFTFEYHGSTSSGITATGVKKTVVGIYTLTVENVPNDDEGTVLVTINKSGIAPATRIWALNGNVVPDADLTAKLLDFRFERSNNSTTLSADAVGGIDHKAGTVVVLAPIEASFNHLIPTLKTNPGNTYLPEVETNFSGEVVYTISTNKTRENNEKVYTVSVIQQTQVSASILFFGFTKEENSAAGLGASVSGIINEEASPKTISVTVPAGTNVSKLKPNITHSGARISPANLASQNFSTPVPYTITAADSTTQTEYLVTVTTDPRAALIPGLPIDVGVAATTAEVSFTGASGLTLSAADFVADHGGVISLVSVSGDTVTMTVTFEQASPPAWFQTYTVSIAAGSTVVRGDAAVLITQGYAAGDRGPAGGWIFFVDTNDDYPDWRYLEAAPADFESTAAWGMKYDGVQGAMSSDFGTGKENTSKFVAKYPGETYAANLCDEYERAQMYISPSGEAEACYYDDWFLPSRDELYEVYLILKVGGLSTFAGDVYWASGGTTNDDSALGMGFNGSYAGEPYQGEMDIQHSVRAIRSF